jgi:hypothetical protein
MSKITFLFALLATALVCFLPAAPLQAQSIRTYVSTTGSDTNPCSIIAPCRHFSAAVAVTSAGGEVDALDPGGYGSLTITQSVTIEGQGWSYVAPGSSGVAIDVNAPSGDVVLRGLSVNGVGELIPTGIEFDAGKSLTVENCVVRNMNMGLLFLSNATTLQTLTVSNSYFNNNAQGVSIVSNSSSAITASIDRTVFSENTSSGLFVQGLTSTGPISVAVTDSVAANGEGGFLVESSAGHSVTNVSLTHSVAIGNSSYGVQAFGTNATIWLAQTTLTGNASGFMARNGGVVASYGDNYLGAANGTPTGSLTGTGKQ